MDLSRILNEDVLPHQSQTTHFSWTLNEDVLIHIFNHVGQRSLLNASRVCRRWHEISQEIIDRTVTLALAGVYARRNLRLFKRILSDVAIRKRIHRIVVRDWHLQKLEKITGDWPWLDGGYFSPAYTGPLDKWWKNTRRQVESLTRCLEILNLRSFTWAAVPHMPKVLMNALQQRRDQCEIEIRKNELWSENAMWSYSPYVNQYALANLSVLPKIVSLQLVIAPTDFGLLEKLGIFLVSRKETLRSLKLAAFGRWWPGRSGSRTDPQWAVPYPHIDEPQRVLVRSIDWLTKPLGDQGERLQLRDIELINVCVCALARPTQLDELIDVHRLASVRLSCFGFLKQCSPVHFSSLNTLSLGYRNGYINDREQCKPDWHSQSVRDFLICCKDLRQLDLVDRPDILSEYLLENIGPRLRALDIHQTTSYMPEQRQFERLHYLDPATKSRPEELVEMISGHCQVLRELAFGVALYGPQVSPKREKGVGTACANFSKFHTVIDLIAKSFPSLQILHLFCQVNSSRRFGSEDHKGFNKSSMLPIWDRYHEHSIGKLTDMAIHLQALDQPARYNPMCLAFTRIPFRTYTVNRSLDLPPGEQDGVNASMAEFERSTREKRERAPQNRRKEFSMMHEQRRALCDDGQLLNDVARLLVLQRD